MKRFGATLAIIGMLLLAPFSFFVSSRGQWLLIEHYRKEAPADATADDIAMGAGFTPYVLFLLPAAACLAAGLTCWAAGARRKP